MEWTLLHVYRLLTSVLGVFAKLKKTDWLLASLCLLFRPSVCPSVRPSAWNNSVSTGRTLAKFYIWDVFWNMLRTFEFVKTGYKEQVQEYVYDNICLKFSGIEKSFKQGFRENHYKKFISHDIFRYSSRLRGNYETSFSARHSTYDIIRETQDSICVPAN
jgi:hypothetical protein